MLESYPYQKNFKAKFKAEKTQLTKAIGDFKIQHVGSTAVPGLGGKGIIDILIGLHSWQQAPTVIKKLKPLSFTHVHPKEAGRIFLSQRAQTGLGDIHIHLAIINGKPYQEFLAFRDYLRKNKGEARRYFRYKQWQLIASCGDRKQYSKQKGVYINKIIRKP